MEASHNPNFGTKHNPNSGLPTSILPNRLTLGR